MKYTFMDYRSIYNLLIVKRKISPAVGITEEHHIIPRCVGGNDDAANLVILTCREHLIAHKLLARFHDNKGPLQHALRMMLLTRRSSRGYETDKLQLRILQASAEYRAHLSARMQRPDVKKKKSDAAKAAWQDPEKRKAFLQNRTLSPEMLKRRAESQAKAWQNDDRKNALRERNRTISEETRAAKSTSMKKVWQNRNAPNHGKRWYNDGRKSFLLLPSDAAGLSLGRLSSGVMTPNKK